MNNAPATNLVHVFEQAGLGKAPFRFVGMEIVKFQACPGAPVQAGGSCDYCAHPIVRFCWIKGADGKQFKVGIECVKKTDDAGLKRKVSEAEGAHKRTLKANAKTRAHDEAVAALPAARAKLATMPHPHPGMASRGATLADWVDWCIANHASLPAVARVVKAAVS